MEFHVWEFPKDFQVRLSDEFIERIRNMTYEKEIYHKATKRRRAFSFKKQCKLIASNSGHPHYKIGHNLYAKHQWHGDGRNRQPHEPFINITQFLKLHQIIKVSLEEMEKNVIAVRSYPSSRLSIYMSFPVTADENWAWLFGIWFSSGGLTTRVRKGKTKPNIEKTVRIRVDKQVYDKQLAPILKKIAYAPKPNLPWYAKKGIAHPLDKQRRPGVGNRPKQVIHLARPIREIMEKFGLPSHISQKSIKGKYASRKFDIEIPEWISNNKIKLHSFIEGYINGSGTGSIFHRGQKGNVERYVEIRFSGVYPAQVGKFFNIVTQYLEELNITGSKHDIHHTHATYWLGYVIHRNSSLYRLYEKFEIQNPPLKSRLTLHYFMNALLYYLCQNLSSSEILILGSLMQGPKTAQEITTNMRFKPSTTKKSFKKLQKLNVVQKMDEKWHVNPTGYRGKLVKRLWQKEMDRRKELLERHSNFFYRCTKCGNIINRRYEGRCGCGGTYKPVKRKEVLKKFRGGRYLSKIKKVSKQQIPHN